MEEELINRSAEHPLKQYNALKYRGYYYDTDLGLYYLNSRYYDPIIGRFINADDVNILSINQDNLLQYNLYAYSFNNPVSYSDDTGRNPVLLLVGEIAIDMALNIATSYLTAKMMGEDYTFMDGLETAGMSIIGSLCDDVKLFYSMFVGGIEFVKSGLEGENIGLSLFNGVVAGLDSYLEISWLPEFDLAEGANLKSLMKVGSELFWGTGRSVTTELVTTTTKKLTAPKSRCSALRQNGGSIDYFIYLLCGGEPW